ncbi:endo alpha-1,4 polygalactosaminidase [Kitasatospora sp. NPDC058965]|uniref:endo alpha-1,4 polygalactosaminidase n=1 Tax=Kitasatospora sp. NPDC058965 TaxID=3346682 RepID=UPI0036BFDA22
MTRRSAALVAALTLTTALLASACGSSGGGDDGDADLPPQPAPSLSDSPTDSPSATASGSPSGSASASGPASPGTPGSSAPGRPGSSPSTPGTTGAVWHPAPGTAWQWQLGGTVDQSVDVPVYDIDGFENSAAVVAALHAKGRKVICYINAGSWEDYRPDAAAFPNAVEGAGNGWQGEKWLDIRQLNVLGPLLGKRFDMCKQKGFDAIEPDLMDAYANKSGFPLTADEQLAFNRMVAKLAHDRGLGVALKNDLDQIPQLVNDFDFAVNEQCAEYSECDKLTPFIQQGKAVLHVEYNVPNASYCAQSKQLQLSSMEKHLELDAWRQPC